MNPIWIEESNEEDGYLVMCIPAKDGSPVVDPRLDDVRRVRITGRVDITLAGADLSRERMIECAKLYRVVKPVRKSA